MRLDQYIAKATNRTRKESRRTIRRGLVSVDGAVVKDAGQHVVPGQSRVRVDGAEVHDGTAHVTLMLHKPLGVVCANRDAQNRTVFDLPSLRAHPRRDDLRCVGRLDKETSGLLLLTTDGGLLHRLTHPKRGVTKRYQVSFAGELVEDAQERVATGLALGDGTVCRPATLEPHGAGRCVIDVHEGKYHQVRRMIAACGGHVTALSRLSVGALQLPDNLAPGDIRTLSDAERATGLET